MIEVSLHHRFSSGATVAVSVETSAARVGLVGPSGVGKTTVLRCIAGLIRPDRGRVIIAGRVLLDSQAGICVPPNRRRVAYVPQDSLLFPHLSVRRNLLFSPSANEAELQPVAEALEIESLLDRRPRHLSGGERQRVALGRALLCEPCVLLCDEPFAALDEARRDRLIAALDAELTRRGLPLILVSHRVAEVQALAQHTQAVEPTG
ncbi:MAG: ATP-binding cassette domain-containing protein [Myxococcota bacterium]